MTKAKNFWLYLMDSLGVPQEQWQPFWLDLEKRYREKHRYYHRLRHIGHFLEVLHQLCAPQSPSQAQQLAAFFHDAIYDPRRHDNEERSAQLALKFLIAVGLEKRFAGAVDCLIMATVDHDVEKAIHKTQKLTGAKPTRAAISQFLDSDLAILGATQHAYDTYCSNIAREYAHVPKAKFAAGRAAFLRTFLAGHRQRLFHSSLGYKLYEGPARANLKRELGRLEGQRTTGKSGGN
jgi:predicted metal-dependent HD superfamily phosphohydrolase